MKGKFALFLCGILCVGLLAGCAGSGGAGDDGETITFVGTVEEVRDGSLLVSTVDDVGFDLADVSLSDDVELDFEPDAGQLLRIAILPQIAESYPVQVTATAIALITDIELSSDGVADVSMTVSDGSVTPTGLTLVITDTNKQPYTYGEWYELQTKTDGEWTEVPCLNGDSGVFSDIGRLPDPDGVLTFDIDWEPIYGALAPGEYRVMKSLCFPDGSRYLYAEFTITAPDVEDGTYDYSEDSAETDKPTGYVEITDPVGTEEP